MVRYTASQSSDGMAGLEGSVSATVCHITAWAMAPRTGPIHAETTARARCREFHGGRSEGSTWPGDDVSTVSEASVLGGLHATVTPFVEITQPTTVDELLRSPAAINGMAGASNANGA